MSKHNHKHTKLIPSPYKVVTEYEKEFIRQGNENIVQGVSEVLKYIATETAKAIKNENEFLNTLK